MPGDHVNISTRKKKRRWFLLLRIVGIIIFFVVLFKMDLDEVWDSLKKVNLFFIFLAILAQLFLLFAKGLRWHQIKTGKDKFTGIYQNLGEFFESYAIGVITPGRVGEFMKAGYEQKKTNMIGAGINVLAERGMDVGIFISFAGAALIWGRFISFGPFINSITFFSGLVIFIFGILMITSGRIYSILDRFINNIKSFYIKRKTQNLIVIVLLTIISNLLYFISCYFISAGGLELPISFIELSGAVAVAGLINLLPVTVMGLGTREVVLLYIFNTYPQSDVFALSGLIFIVAQLGGGLIALFLGQIFLFLQQKSGK
jgi:uncharacterized membrane protein YbhN (UPF0104 family)